MLHGHFIDDTISINNRADVFMFHRTWIVNCCMQNSMKSILDFTETEFIARFFLDLYRLQLGPSDSQQNTAQFVPLASRGFGSDRTYELRVKYDGGLRSRRMTIGPLGENIESKSMCYKVVYDDILVVKIPPNHIKDFDKYIVSIEWERRILEKLAPSVKCVSPNVSAVLKRIPNFRNKENLPPDELEKKYIDRLRKDPGSQSHLRIGSSFVFFTNLSKYPFLSEVVEEMHHKDVAVQDEILKNEDALRNIDAFEVAYGGHNDSVFFRLNDVYNDYEKRIDQLVNQYGIASSVPAYMKKEWFLFYLAERELRTDEKGFPDGFVDDRNVLLEKLFRQKRKDIVSYKKTVTKYVRERRFNNNRSSFKAITTNILELIYRLAEQGVAIRDLKSDNIFISLNTEEAVHSLASAEDYSLGLIDLETAVIFKTIDNEKIPQPLLAGTPSYATPTHVFENELLCNVFDDLPRILYLQDWYAAIGMIYNVVTGEILFKKTGRLLPEIIEQKQESMGENDALADTFKNTSWIFWTSAVDEFNERINASKNVLGSIRIVIHKNFSRMFKQELFKEKEVLSETIRKQVASQKIFKNEKSRQSLIKSSHTAISRYKTNWEKGVNIPEASATIREEVIRLLQNLEYLKHRLEEQIRIFRVLDQQSVTISVYKLLKLLFSIVLNCMYRQEWTDRKHPQISVY